MHGPGLMEMGDLQISQDIHTLQLHTHANATESLVQTGTEPCLSAQERLSSDAKWNQETGGEFPCEPNHRCCLTAPDKEDRHLKMKTTLSCLCTMKHTTTKMRRARPLFNAWVVEEISWGLVYFPSKLDKHPRCFKILLCLFQEALKDIKGSWWQLDRQAIFTVSGTFN